MELVRRLFLILVLVTGAIAASTGVAAAAAPPVGVFDTIVIGTDESIIAYGWAYDADDPTVAVDIHIYVDGELAAFDAADSRRADVDAAFGVGENHGFAIPLALTDGRYEVCAFAIDVASTNQGNPSLGCADLQVGEPTPGTPPPVAPSTSPVGRLDVMTPRSNGSGFTVAGWAYDPTDPDRTVVVHVYQGTTIVSAKPADGLRPDVDTALGGVGLRHGFALDIAVPVANGDEICVWAIATSGTPHTQIGCATVSGTNPEPTGPPPVRITPDSPFGLELVR